jgi:molybdopterin-guanine dinucleotide biosynthesis protein B
MKNSVVFGFYGDSAAGKTMLIERVIKELTAEGYRVSSIKRTDKNISLDIRNKDTWRHAQAGSSLVVFSSPIETTVFIKTGMTETEVLKNVFTLGSFDVVLAEGAQDKIIPKIRVGDTPERDNTVFEYQDNFDELIAVIKQAITEKTRSPREKIRIAVNGKQIPLTEFPAKFIKSTISGMLSSLKGVDEVHKAEIIFET